MIRLRLPLIGVGLVLACIGLALNSRPIVWAAIVSLALAVVLRLIARSPAALQRKAKGTEMSSKP